MKKTLCLIFLFSTLVCSCSQEDVMVNLGIDDIYAIERMRLLKLHPEFPGDGYIWSMTDSNGNDSVIGTDRDLFFCKAEEGEYRLRLQIQSKTDPIDHHFRVIVREEEVAYSPYIASVYEYCPAPGQFVNIMPLYEEGDNAETMRQKAQNDLTNDVMISLGAYGGYVTFAFDHTVVNVEGKKDFFIKGNCFYSDIPYYKDKKGGSAEPGIVLVAMDKNQNGRPDDDEWYELAGSEYHKPTTIKHYSLTYYKPDNHTPVPDAMGTLTDTLYIPWTDNQGQKGYVAKNKYHEQSYYPLWIDSESITFNGTLLPHNGVDESGFGSYFVLYSYPWGYADNHPNDFRDLSSFDIGWAVDSNGNKVYLPGIDFIRVYTGVNQYCGWLGETSTEISMAQDLHVADPKAIPDDPIK